jgi:hypothetical protein
MVEINKRLKADPGLHRAFGRMGCAEQPVVQDTFDACTAENVAQTCPIIARLGIQRLVRDVFRVDGLLFFDQTFNLLCVILNQADPFAKELSIGLASLLTQEHVAVALGET